LRKLFIGMALACLLAAFPAAAGSRVVATHATLRFDPNKKISQSTSSNWSGYSAINGRYTTVSAAWTQPTASCTSATTYSSFWVGLDGDGSNTVEQTGTSADCSGGQPKYYAWYEMYPKFPTNLSIAIRPGDKLTASVTTDGNGKFTLTINDATSGGSYQTVQRLKHATLSSAEAIAEAPSGSGGVLPLTNFGTVNFSSVTVNGAAIGTFNPDKIDMVSGGVTKATTSQLSGGNAFSVTWNHS
jgi:peptidase A4-like protein